MERSGRIEEQFKGYHWPRGLHGSRERGPPKGRVKVVPGSPSWTMSGCWCYFLSQGIVEERQGRGEERACIHSLNSFQSVFCAKHCSGHYSYAALPWRNTHLGG